MNSKRFLSCLLGTLVATQLSALAAEEANPPGTAKRVIYLNMQGGMSQWETFDPKEGNGPAGIIQSPDSKISISAWLPKTANLLSHCLILRNVGGLPSHVPDQTQHTRMTGYTKRTTIDHPDIGAWIKFLLPRTGPYLKVSSQNYTSAGFFPAKDCSPVVFSSPSQALTPGGSAQEWQVREELQTTLNRFSSAKSPQLEDSLPAFRFFASENGRDAMQWNTEPKETLRRYGDHDFGKSCLLARRLAEKADAVFVEVALSGWNLEGTDYFKETKKLCRQLDDGFSALLTDLIDRELLATTLVVIASDYGRSAHIEDENFRVFSSSHSSALLAGGGVNGGTVYGVTATANGRPISGKVSARQFNSIIARSLKLNPYETVYSPSRRPFTIGEKSDTPEAFQAVFGSE